MEYSWSYVNGAGKGLVSNDITSPTKNSWMTSYSNNSLLVSGHSWIENHGFGDLTMQETMGKQTTINNSIRNPHAICSKIGDARLLMNPIMVTGNAFCGDDRLSSSVVDSNNSRDSSLIALKLGRLADQRDAATNSIDYRNTPPKRPRMGGLNSQLAYCQVHGCNKDLSASKEYHRRHKVCEVHSKTAKVIVNGIEKRFCQQCSRFHLLGEFDDGKRSCRKRLAGHNERRRKPQAGGHSGRFLQSCNGFTGSSLTATSFICQDIFQGGRDKYRTTDWHRSVKVEQGSDYSHLPSAPIITNGPYYSKSLFLLDDLKRPAYFTPVNSLSSIPEPGFALSLLSSQSHNSSSGIPIMMPGSIRSYNVGQISDRLGSQASNSNKFSSPGISSVDGSQVGPMLISDDSDAVNFDITNGIYHRSSYMNAKDCLSCENGTTADLLQLSSQLQQVEHQRQSMPLKPINNR